MKLEFAELQNPLFLAGKNHGTKLHATRPGDPALDFNEEKNLLYIQYNGKLGLIPLSNVVSMTPKAEEEKEVLQAPENNVQTAPTGKHQKNRNAQVNTPTSHVFGEGPGHS